jgi:hypothetical protein
MSESEVQVEYQYSEAEYLAANRLFFFKSSNAVLRLAVFCALAFLFAVVFSLVFADLFPLWASLSIVALFLGVLFYNVLWGLPRKYFRKNRSFREKYQITFSDEGVHVKTSQIDSKLGWGLYTKVFENPDMYLLVYGTDIRMMTTVPKRSFKSSDQEYLFRQLVARHITNNSGLKQVPSQEGEYKPPSLTPPDWR